MIDKVVVFTGSKKDFEIFLEKQIPEDSETIPFMELIQHYNARLRPNESGVRENALRANIEVDNCVVRADDYGSVMPHVLSNFANIVNLNYDMGTLYIQNPPRRVLESLKAWLDGDIEYYGSQYPELDRDALTKIYKALNSDVYGQDECKKQILSGMYRLTTGATNKPVVLMLYGPSGVGKTESAKSISKSLGGELLRIQFSMMQTSEAYDYVFGAEHSKRICATGCCTKPHIKQRGSDGVTRQELFTWIRQQYGTEPEYPWHDWNAVLRHNDNNKWYGVVLEVSADKLGLPEVGIIDVLNVKSDPLLIGSLRGQDGYFPAYHMNKEKWLSIQLGKPELDDAIKDLLSLSHELTAPKKRNRKLPANNPGDSANGKEKETDKG